MLHDRVEDIAKLTSPDLVAGCDGSEREPDEPPRAGEGPKDAPEAGALAEEVA